MASYGPVGDFPVKGKIVLITGGGSGIGFAFAQLCCERGARVAIGDLRLTPEAEAFVAQQQQQQQPATRVIFRVCDVTSRKSMHDLITAAREAFGEVPDVYAPVAGVLDPAWSNFWDDTEDDDYKTFRINVNHPLKLTRLAMRALLSEDKKGVVCLVSSSAGIRGNYFAPLYASTKHAVVGFAKSLGQADPDQGIRVVCILPGTVKSNLWEGRGDHVAEATRYSERKLMPPSAVAETMLRMVEDKEYSGGTCVLKTIAEERVIEEGWEKQAEKYDPSPRPEPDISHLQTVLAGERAKKWEG